MKSCFRNILIFTFLLIVLPPGMVTAQLNQGGIPLSFTLSIPPDVGGQATVTPPSLDGLQQEDEQKPLPYRFAVNIPVDLDINSAGSWVKSPDGTNIWRLTIKSPGAMALTLYFDQFQIPAGGKLFVYNPARTQWLGAFTSLNNNELSTFATGLIYGDQLTLEYNAPAGMQLPLLHIFEVAYAYRGVSNYSGLKTGFGSAGKCMVNVNCSEGDHWSRQKRSVARIEVKKGSSTSWCSGSLVNNTKNDGTPYILTADHCGYSATELDLSMWQFYFEYESSGCPNPSQEPPLKSMTGATLVARSGGSAWTGSDFFMVLLKEDIPESFNAYYNGWSRAETSSPSGTGIHHPQGDIKKISTYTAPLQPTSYPGNPNQAHWQVTWSATVHGYSVTEGGSSGSPIYDPFGRIVGTLTGGDSKCDSSSLGLPDYYGMFSYHWDQNGTEPGRRLQPWLDPIDAGVMELNGWAVSVEETLQDEWIRLYPNPVIDMLNVAATRPDGDKIEIMICDLVGNQLYLKEFKSQQSLNEQIDMTGMGRGMYMVIIQSGERRVVKKIIKQ